MMDAPRLDRSHAGNALLFAAIGAASRYTFQTVESRWQIAALAGLAGLVEVGRRTRPSLLRWAIGASAAAAAVVCVKYMIEPTARHVAVRKVAVITERSVDRARAALAKSERVP